MPSYFFTAALPQYSQRDQTTTGPGEWIDIRGFNENSSIEIVITGTATVTLEGTNDIQNGNLIVPCDPNQTTLSVWWITPKECSFLRTNTISISGGTVSSGFSSGLFSEREKRIVSPSGLGVGEEDEEMPSFPPRVDCYVYASGGITVAAGPDVFVPFANENYKNVLLHDNSTNNSRITIPTGQAGVYEIIGNVTWLQNADVTGVRQCSLQINRGGQIDYGGSIGSATDAVNTRVVEVLELSDGDYVELDAYQSSGSTLTLEGGTSGTGTFMIVRRVE